MKERKFWHVADGGKRTFWGVAFIPMCYVLTSFLLDLTLFVVTKIHFPKYYSVSAMFLVVFAGAVSCIPKRWIQIVIFVLCAALQTFTTIANLIAFFNLNQEMFIFETLRSLREVFSGAHAVKYKGIIPYTITSLIMAAFFCVCVFVGVKYKKQKAGYLMRPLIAVTSAIMIVFAGIFTNLAFITLSPNNASSLTRITDPRFNLEYFTDRTSVLYNFGSPIYYFNNILSIAGLKSMSTAPVAGEINKCWDGSDYYGVYQDDEGNSLMLDSNCNCIMLMMETMEFNGINPTNTPNLWNLRNNSTWVDGYYSVERTCFTEYNSLTGGHARGVEMERDYPDLAVPQSMPNIFRRSYEADATLPEPQVAAFHTYDDEFYNRAYAFNKGRLGFDFIHDLKYYEPSVEYTDDWSDFSDEEFMQKAVADMAPTDRRFYSWYLGVSTHAPHLNSPHTTYVPGSAEPFPFNVRNSYYPESLEYVQENFDKLSQDYPKLVTGSPTVKLGTLAYLVSLHVYDNSIGILLDYLQNNIGPDGKRLIDTTALVLYSDHYDFMTYANPPLNPLGGSLLTDNNNEGQLGEKLAFMIYNPKDIGVTNGNINTSEAVPGTMDTGDTEFGTQVYGRKITCFMANNDIYKTVCHLFNIETNGDFTLGSSILARINKNSWQDYDISVGISYYNGLFFGIDLENSDLTFTTRDFKGFITSTGVKTPSLLTINVFKNRMEDYADTLIKLRSYYDGNKFKDDPKTFQYYIGNGADLD